jgi:serine/threonine protein kinase
MVEDRRTDIALEQIEQAGREARTCGGTSEVGRDLAKRGILVSMSRIPDLSGSALDGRYELHALIGEGAFGRVYRGRDRRLARTVAVKVIKPWWAEDSAWVKRFQREAQLLARISDPGIVQIYDIGHADAGPYYVAELVDGESLAERLRRGPLAVAEAREIAEQLAHALAGAHAQGIVHCDVKPANVLITAAGKVKVGDFGVARLAEGTSQAPSATVAGTPRYMSPEQARGRPSGPATDVYSAGVVLYEMLAGEPPFVDGSAVELGLRHVQEQPPRLRGEIPSALREVVERALAKDPADRYRDGSAMAAALRAAKGALEKRSVADEPAGNDSRDGGGDGSGSAPEEASSAATAVLAELAAIDRSTAATVVASSSSTPTRIMIGGSGASAPPPASPGRRKGMRAPRPRRIALLAVLLALGAGILAVVLVLLGQAAAAHTAVPELRGLPREGVEARARRLHLQPAFSSSHSPTAAGIAIAQDPSSGTRVAAGATVHVVLSLGPQWRALTTFSGVDDGRSVPFRILGGKWRVTYSMSYEGTCTLLVVCFGPSAEVENLHGSGSSFGSFELGEGENETHTFDSGPGLYRLMISGGHDSARWSMTVEDYD